MDESPFILSDAQLARRRRRVFPLEAGGEVYYVKTARVRKYHIGHRIQKLCHALTGNPLLIPTVFTDIRAAMHYETRKLRLLRAKKLPVPEVVYEEARYFVTRDVGRPLHKVIRRERKRGQEYALRAIRTLAQLHHKGFAHGGAQLKNFTLKKDAIHLIDFEKNVEVAALHEMQFRDVLLFLIHLEGLRLPISYPQLTEAYEAASPLEIHPRLREIPHALRLLKLVDIPPLTAIPMKDVRIITRLMKRLENL